MKKKSNLLKRSLTFLTAFSLVSAVTFTGQSAASAQSDSEGGCRPYVVLVIPGTSETERGSNRIGFMTTVTDPLSRKAPGKFLIQTVDYPAAAGGMIAPVYGTKTPFADSVKEGIDLTLKYAAEYKNRCPGVKFAMVGFSQGAMIAGDVSEIIGNGKSGDITSDDMIGSLAYADPRRAPNHVDGKQVQREGSEKTLGEYGNTTMSGEGIFGYRKDYGEMTSKTVSICYEKDSVCNTPLEGRKATDWLAAIGEYNTGTNYEQVKAYQEAGFGEAGREVAAVSTNSAMRGDPQKMVAERASNPASLISMLYHFADFAPNAIEDDPMGALAEILGTKPQSDDPKTSAELLRKGLTVESLLPFLSHFAISSSEGAHGYYAQMVVDEKGTTSTEWGANWLAARMN